MIKMDGLDVGCKRVKVTDCVRDDQNFADNLSQSLKSEDSRPAL